MNHHKLTSLLAVAVFGFAGSSTAAAIFSDSFDYGASDISLNSAGAIGNWGSSGSSLLIYDADGGLDHPQMSGETGGALYRNYTTDRTISNSDINFDLSTTGTNSFGAGDTVWMASLFQYVAGGEQSLLISGGSVSGMGYTINSGGSVSVTATINATVNANNSTGLSLGTGTYLMLARYTKGTGTSPIDSSVDLWINPTNTSSVASLGAANWTLDSGDGQIKWGRDGNTLSSLSVTTPAQGRSDEIRIGTSFSDLNLAAVPEASTALLGAFGLALTLLRRRR